MGDIWPYGPPNHTTWQAVYDEAFTWYASASIAATFAAIAGAETGGSYDLSVINDTPSTGDYSVGTLQINYFGSLYAGRAAAYGTPQQLVQGGLSRQFVAARGIYAGQGFGAWSTYRSGAYLAYLHGNAPATGGSAGGQPTLQLGASGPAVTTLQNDLDQLGANLSQDGSFGPLTRQAVIAFQGSHGLVPDGVVGPLTWAGITAALPKQSPLGGPAPGPLPPSEAPGNIDGDTINAWGSLATTVTSSMARLLTSAASANNTLNGV